MGPARSGYLRAGPCDLKDLLPGLAMQKSPSLKNAPLERHWYRPLLPRPTTSSGLQIPTGFLVNSGSQVSLGYQSSPAMSGSQVPSHRPMRMERKSRTVYSKEQLRVLEDYFQKCNYPPHKDQVLLAERINLTEYETQVCPLLPNQNGHSPSASTHPSSLPALGVFLHS